MPDIMVNRLAIDLQRLLARDDTPADLDRFGEIGTDDTHGVAAAYLYRLQSLKLKMYQEPGHSLPHLHVDYGKDHHVASYGIDPPVRLAGTLSGKYDRTVVNWIKKHKGALIEFWRSLQLGESNQVALAQLQGEA